MWRFIARRAPACRPGVSTKMICASGRVRMPRMRCRVVCGFGLTMLILRPSSAFSSVDLPTFGRPTIAANPQRCARLHGRGARSPLVLPVTSASVRSASVARRPARRGAGSRRWPRPCRPSASTEQRTWNDLIVRLARSRFDRIDGQRQAARLQRFLQTRLGILEFGRARQPVEPRHEQPLDHAAPRRRSRRPDRSRRTAPRARRPGWICGGSRRTSTRPSRAAAARRARSRRR